MPQSHTPKSKTTPSKGKTEVHAVKSKKTPKRPSVAVSHGSIKPRFLQTPGPKGSLTISAVDYIGPLSIPADTIPGPTAGDLLFIQAIAPRACTNSKQSSLASMYERYFYRKVRFHYAPAVGTSTSGSCLMFIDKDVTDNIAEGQAGVRHAMGVSRCTQFAFWEKAMVEYIPENFQLNYFTSLNDEGDTRLDYAGNMVCMLMNPGALTAGATLGDLWMEYELIFLDPTYENPDTTVSTSMSSYSNAVPGLLTFNSSESDPVPHGFDGLPLTNSGDFRVRAHGGGYKGIHAYSGTHGVFADFLKFSPGDLDFSDVAGATLVVSPMSSGDLPGEAAASGTFVIQLTNIFDSLQNIISFVGDVVLPLGVYDTAGVYWPVTGWEITYTIISALVSTAYLNRVIQISTRPESRVFEELRRAPRPETLLRNLAKKDKQISSVKATPMPTNKPLKCDFVTLKRG